MNEKECEFEQQVKQLAGRHSENTGMRRHLAGCPACRETAKIAGWMHRFASETNGPQDLRPAGSILFKARLIEKQTAVRRALLPIMWMKALAAGLAVSGLVILQLTGSSAGGPIVAASFRAFAVIAPLAIIAVICAALLCVGVERLFRDAKTGIGPRGPRQGNF